MRVPRATRASALSRIDREALSTPEANEYTVTIGASMAFASLNGAHYNTVTDLGVTADGEKGYVSTANNAGTVVVYSSTDANGKFRLDGNARRWCYNDMEASPNYTSFYKEKVLYKSYEIVDNGKARQTFVDEDEVTMTNKK